jgi:hypothetical protein
MTCEFVHILYRNIIMIKKLSMHKTNQHHSVIEALWAVHAIDNSQTTISPIKLFMYYSFYNNKSPSIWILILNKFKSVSHN